MKLKVKHGGHLLSISEPDGKIACYNQKFIIVFINKYTYRSFCQHKNHLFIDTTEGEVDLVFTGIVPRLDFDYFCKDQLVLTVIQGQ